MTLAISPRGPLMQFLVGVSGPRATALRAANQLVPAQIPITGLIDTGASSTVIDSIVLGQLAIPTTGTTPIHTPSTQADAPHFANQYDISLTFIHPWVTRTFPAVPITDAQLVHQGIQALIGRDILGQCLLTYDGVGRSFCLAF
ncbi:MAG TPA: hypothetical protein VL970_10675 [Candidatus Acidoferrales bacterium]|nr:hypothetical protein [Candidatus Acidoferrales bacterium]